MSRKNPAPPSARDWFDGVWDTPIVVMLRTMSPAARQRLDDRLRQGVTEAMATGAKSVLTLKTTITPNVEAERVELETVPSLKLPNADPAQSTCSVGFKGSIAPFGEKPVEGEGADVTPINGKRSAN